MWYLSVAKIVKPAQMKLHGLVNLKTQKAPLAAATRIISGSSFFNAWAVSLRTIREPYFRPCAATALPRRPFMGIVGRITQYQLNVNATT